jgi:hypothetical protein
VEPDSSTSASKAVSITQLIGKRCARSHQVWAGLQVAGIKKITGRPGFRIKIVINESADLSAGAEMAAQLICKEILILRGEFFISLGFCGELLPQSVKIPNHPKF